MTDRRAALQAFGAVDAGVGNNAFVQALASLPLTQLIVPQAGGALVVRQPLFLLRGAACRKTAIVCEAFGQRCEIHMAGWGNLQVMGATSEDTSEWYEKGLLGPGVEYAAAPLPQSELRPDGRRRQRRARTRPRGPPIERYGCSRS